MADMYIIGFFLLLGIVFFLQSRAQQKRYLEELKRKCHDSWGKEREREYSYEEFSRIPHYYRKQSSADGIDDATWNDLDMDSVFMKLNHTFSSVGEEYLYAILRTPNRNEEDLARFTAKTDWLREHKAEALSLQEIFCRMGYARRIAISDYLFHLPDVLQISLIKEYAVLILFFAAIAASAFGFAPAPVLCLLFICYNVVSYYGVKGRIENSFPGIAYLVTMTSYAEELSRFPYEILKEDRDALSSCSSVFSSCRKWASLISLGGSVSGSLVDILMDYVRIFFHVDLIAYEKIIHTVKDNPDALSELFKRMGMIESCLAVASWQDSLPYYCTPELSFSDKPFLKTEGIYHPLIEKPVSNDFSTECSILVTGSNASGKSTFLKTVAVCSILAQTIHTVPARNFESVYCRILSSMSIKDHLEAEESYFMAEIRSIRRMFRKEEDLTDFVFIDEVLRGTNTVERIAASTKILASLAEGNRLCFAATHDVELTSLMEAIYDNYHFTEEIEENDIHFSYRLLPGRTESRNAIRLLSLMGYSEEIVIGAEKMAAHFLETGEWSDKL